MHCLNLFSFKRSGLPRLHVFLRQVIVSIKLFNGRKTIGNSRGVHPATVFSLEEANIAQKFRQPKFTRRNENKFSYSLQKLKICFFYVAVVHQRVVQKCAKFIEKRALIGIALPIKPSLYYFQGLLSAPVFELRGGRS